MPNSILGWDIGGAHLKAVLISQPANIIAVYQEPCPLWQGIDKLITAAQAILRQITIPIHGHSFTMTGELVDLFSSRCDGVQQILAAMHTLVGSGSVWVYAGQDGIINLKDVNAGYYPAIASANWLASANWAAHTINHGLFIDIGSTTTDILLLHDGKVLAEGYTDYERLISKELIYTGVVRTPVMAVTPYAQDKGKEVGLMAEYFATMADVYRITNELNEHHDQYNSADGADKTPSASAKRLARMIGCDYHADEAGRWQPLARNIREQQLNRILQGCKTQLARKELPMDAPLIGAGIGRFLIADIAMQLKRPYLDFTHLFKNHPKQADYCVADCAPAAAVACLVQ